MGILKIQSLHLNDLKLCADVAEMLADTWPKSYQDNAIEEVTGSLADDRVALVAVEGKHAVGFVGAIAQYGTTGWELHPLVIRKDRRGQGIGALLLSAIEKEVSQKGGVTLYLGSDDEDSKTSLSNTNLYEQTYQKIANIQNLKQHPFTFYQKYGYHIVGVIPDANGVGKPDIWMAKRIAQT